jgi:acetylornithine/N-succinyldiaminopimelate aminotransferase
MTERELFFRYLGLPSFHPLGLEIVKAEGIYLWDSTGKKYIDLVSGVAVSNIGHRHHEVVRAIKEQLDKYLYLNVYGEFIQSPQVRLAQRITGLLPSALDSVYFVNSGTEAVEGALKLAKRFTGRTGIIAFRDAYHGSTQGALSVLGNEVLKNAFRPLLPDITFLEFNHLKDAERISLKTACVIVETIQAEAGIILPEPGFLELLRKKYNETGTLLIIDDVQMGFGRTGRMFSFEHYNIIPDILVLAKALGAGMPLGAFISSKIIMDKLAFDPELGHITTFGGHPVSCAAALAGLEILIEPGFIEAVEEKGNKIEEGIKGHKNIKAIRRKGLAMGVDLNDPAKRQVFTAATLNQGLVIDWYLFKPATFRIAPPLTLTDEEIKEICKLVNGALSDLEM